MDNDSDLPQLKSIQLGTEAFYGDDSDDRKTMIDQSCTSKNTLTMKSISLSCSRFVDLPSFSSFKGQYDNFVYIGSVIFESSHLVDT